MLTIVIQLNQRCTPEVTCTAGQSLTDNMFLLAEDDIGLCFSLRDLKLPCEIWQLLIEGWKKMKPLILNDFFLIS